MRRSRGWADETGLGGISRRTRTSVASAPHYKFAEYANGRWPYNRAFPFVDREVVEMSIPRNAIAIAAFITATVAAASAHAEIGVAVTATLGTTGAGVHLVVPMASTTTSTISTSVRAASITTATPSCKRSTPCSTGMHSPTPRSASPPAWSTTATK
jgi:hypothetical protein